MIRGLPFSQEVFLFAVLMVLGLSLWTLRIIAALFGPGRTINQILVQVGIEVESEAWYRVRSRYRWIAVHPYSMMVCIVPFVWLGIASIGLQAFLPTTKYGVLLFGITILGFAVLLWVGEIVRLRWLMRQLGRAARTSTQVKVSHMINGEDNRDRKNPYEAPRIG
jgi:hypothetical protein